MPDRPTTTQAELDEGYRAIIDALDVTDPRQDLERALAILGYTTTILLVAIKAERRFEEVMKFAGLLLDNTHRGILRELTETDDDPDA